MPLFTPPVVADQPWVNADTPPLSRRLFRYYGPLDRGRTVLKIAGQYLTVDTPDQITLSLATEVYLGGHIYTVSVAVGEALVAAGYTVADMPPPGVNTLSLPLAVGSYASTPDSAANSITADIDLRVRLSMVDWTPDAEKWFIAKWQSSTLRSYAFGISSNNRLYFLGSSTGSNVYVAEATAAHGYVNGTAHWVRTTHVQSSGVSTFYLSEDGTAWTQLGATVASGGFSIADTTAMLEVGSVLGGTSGNLNGNIYTVQVRNGIGGPVVAVFDATAVTKLGTRNPSSFVASTGETWTINGTTWDWVVVA